MLGCAGGEDQQPSTTSCGVRDWSYAQLLLDLQKRGASGVVVGAPEGSDVFQLECRQVESQLGSSPAVKANCSDWSVRTLRGSYALWQAPGFSCFDPHSVRH